MSKKKYAFFRRGLMNFYVWYKTLLKLEKDDDENVSRDEFLKSWDEYNMKRYGGLYKKIKDLKSEEIGVINDFVSFIEHYLVDISLLDVQEGIRKGEKSRDECMKSNGIQKAVYSIRKYWDLYKESHGIEEFEKDDEDVISSDD